MRGLTVGQGSREAANGPEYLLMRTQAQWPLDDWMNPRDIRWLRAPPSFCEKWGVNLSVVAGAPRSIQVWYASVTITPVNNGNGNGAHS